MKLFKLVKYIFLLFVLGVSVMIIFLWNIQEDLPDSNISEYFPNEITKIYDNNYDLLYHVGARDRFYIEYEKIPPEMIQAIISAEDKTFFQHQGYDVGGIINAFIVNLKNIYSKNNNNYVGASTITQQLVKNILLNNDQTITRKVKELILSIRIENNYSKEFILELYLNEIYFGRRSYGIASAANNYFNKSIFDLDIHEFAYLAALPKGPNNYDPSKNYQKAFDRRNYVLKQMFLNSFLNETELELFSSKEIILSKKNIKKYNLDYKTDYILQQLSQNSISSNAFYIQSTIDQNLQNIAEKSLLDNLLSFEKKYKKWSGSFKDKNKIQELNYSPHWFIGKVEKIHTNSVDFKLINTGEFVKVIDDLNLFGPDKQKPSSFLEIDEYVYLTLIDDQYYLAQDLDINGSVLVMDPFNGNILAMVGGTNYKKSNFNRATQAFRQPGSSIKPFIYASALENKLYLPNSLILDSNVLLEQGPNLPIWIPKNYSDQSYGEMTFRKALENSNNLITLKIGLDLGINQISNFFEDINLYKKNENKDVYSSLLGAIENNLLNITKTYSIFLNGGYLVEPNIIKKVVSDQGELVANQDYYSCNFCNFEISDRSYRKPQFQSNQESVVSPQTSFQILSILRGAVERGTGKSLNNIQYPIAGKTGTTNDSKDLWFFGLTPKFVVGVYVGYDTPKKIGYRETGSSVALPIFKSFMETYLKEHEDNQNIDFFIPNDIILKKVDANTGKFESENSSIIEYFTKDQLETINNLNKVNSIGGIN
ncbi:PBP1A family penicillin-binding protein [Alphaproteobacteria bacterium]|nr:PBP1A family penicillin-binding protein [Alphaproteobacteria bacterium]